MRVALVAFYFSEYAVRLAQALAETHTVLLILNQRNANSELTTLLRQQMAGRFELALFRRSSLLRVPAQLPRVLAVLAAFRPDVVHHQEVGGPLVPLLTRLPFPRAPIVLTVHDPMPHSGIDTVQSRRAFPSLRRMRNRARRIIVHGERIAAEWAASEPAIAGKLDPVPHGVLGDAQPSPLPEGEPTFLFFGRIEAYKGLDVFLDAIERLNARGTRVHAIVAGQGTDLDRHRSRIARSPSLTLLDRFIAPDEVAALFARATAVVLPYRDGTQSGVAALAMGAGRPVIATDVGSLPESVIDGVCGLIIPPSDATALANAMVRLVEDSALLLRLAAGARTAAQGHLSWSSIARTTTAVYARAIASADGAPGSGASARY